MKDTKSLLLAAFMILVSATSNLAADWPQWRGPFFNGSTDEKDLPASCTIGDWLRRMGRNGEGLPGLDRVNQHLVVEGLRRDKRTEYTLDVDAVVIESEKEEAQWTYKKEKGYQNHQTAYHQLKLSHHATPSFNPFALPRPGG